MAYDKRSMNNSQEQISPPQASRGPQACLRYIDVSLTDAPRKDSRGVECPFDGDPLTGSSMRVQGESRSDFGFTLPQTDCALVWLFAGILQAASQTAITTTDISLN